MASSRTILGRINDIASVVSPRLSEMKHLYTLTFLFLLISEEKLAKLIDLPFSLRKYDQSDILLEEEDKRDLLRDIKTVYAPEYRIYTNGSIGTLVRKEKREICKYRPREEFIKCTRKKIRSTPDPINEDDRIQMAKNNILETFDMDDNLLDTPDANSWLNYTTYLDPGIQRGQDFSMELNKNLTNVSSLDLSVFWLNEKSTKEIRKLQGA